MRALSFPASVLRRSSGAAFAAAEGHLEGAGLGRLEHFEHLGGPFGLGELGEGRVALEVGVDLRQPHDVADGRA